MNSCLDQFLTWFRFKNYALHSFGTYSNMSVHIFNINYIVSYD